MNCINCGSTLADPGLYQRTCYECLLDVIKELAPRRNEPNVRVWVRGWIGYELFYTLDAAKERPIDTWDNEGGAL